MAESANHVLMCTRSIFIDFNEKNNFSFLQLDDVSWTQEREVTLERVENKSFGISIVGGKVSSLKKK